jgi:hypothetical protein
LQNDIYGGLERWLEWKKQDYRLKCYRVGLMNPVPPEDRTPPPETQWCDLSKS